MASNGIKWYLFIKNTKLIDKTIFIRSVNTGSDNLMILYNQLWKYRSKLS